MKRFVLKFVSALCLVLAFSPVMVLLGGGLSPWLRMLWPVSAVLLALLVGYLPRRARLPVSILVALGFAAGSLFLFPQLWYYPIPSLAAYVMVLRYRAAPPFEEWSSSVLIMGFCVFPVSMMVARGMGALQYWPMLRGLFLAYIPVLLLLTNHASLAVGASARDGRRPPARIRTGNRRLAIGIAAVVLIVANIGAIRDVFYGVSTWIATQVGRFILWLSNLLMPQEMISATPQGGQSSGMEMLEEGEPALFWVILEKILMVAALILAAIAAVYLAKKLAKVIRRGWHWLMARLRAAAHHLGEGVQEKTESILDWGELRSTTRERMHAVRKRLTRPPRWQSLPDSRARVRWAYARWLAAHPEAPEAQTARETLRNSQQGPRMADVYDRARYSELEITEEEAVFMRDTMAHREE